MAWREDVNFGRVTMTIGAIFPEYAVADLPAAALHTGEVVFVSDGNAGEECLARSNGTAWISLATGAEAADS